MAQLRYFLKRGGGRRNFSGIKIGTGLHFNKHTGLAAQDENVKTT